MANTRLWDQVCKTDPAFTKEVSFGRTYTAIDPQYQLHEATKLWGPMGLNWGIDVDEVKYITVNAWNKKAGAMVETVSAVLSATLWYRFEEHRGAVAVIVDMPFTPGDDCHKKLLTAARSKALSMLGFNSDVYEGKFEDVDYVKSAKLAAMPPDAFEATVLKNLQGASESKRKDLMDKFEAMFQDGTITEEQIEFIRNVE